MRRLSFSVSPEKEQDLLPSNFIVFDVAKKRNEQEPPTVFFYRTLISQPNKRPIEPENISSILVGFIQITKLFASNELCNYILTSQHEIALCELSNGVWISACREKSDNRNPQLIKTLLNICKDMYKLFFPDPVRGEDNRITNQSGMILKAAFNMISSTISWVDNNFLNLFKSTFEIQLPTSVLKQLSKSVKSVLSTGAFISHIMIFYGRFTVFSTLPMDISTTLSICMKQKLQYLFPQKVKSETGKLFWVIGLRMSQHNFLSVYAPNVIIDGSSYPMVCLKKDKMKVVLLLNPKIQPTPEALSGIPKIISPITRIFSSLSMVTKRGSVQGSYIVVKNNLVNRQLETANEKLTDPQIPFVEHSIVNTSHCIHEIDSGKSEIGMPMEDDFVAYATYNKKMEGIVLYRSEESLYDSLQKCKELLEPGGCRWAEIIEL